MERISVGDEGREYCGRAGKGAGGQMTWGITGHGKDFGEIRGERPREGLEQRWCGLNSTEWQQGAQ